MPVGSHNISYTVVVDELLEWLCSAGLSFRRRCSWGRTSSLSLTSRERCWSCSCRFSGCSSVLFIPFSRSSPDSHHHFGQVVSVHPIVKWMVTFLQMVACDGTLPLIAYISVAQAILNYCGFLCLVPLVPEMAGDLGMSSAVAGLILSAPTFGQVFATPLDRHVERARNTLRVHHGCRRPCLASWTPCDHSSWSETLDRLVTEWHRL